MRCAVSAQTPRRVRCAVRAQVAVCRAGDAGLASPEPVQLSHFVCRVGSGAVAARIGAAVQLVAVALKSGDVALHKLYGSSTKVEARRLTLLLWRPHHDSHKARSSWWWNLCPTTAASKQFPPPWLRGASRRVLGDWTALVAAAAGAAGNGRIVRGAAEGAVDVRLGVRPRGAWRRVGAAVGARRPRSCGAAPPPSTTKSTAAFRSFRHV